MPFKLLIYIIFISLSIQSLEAQGPRLTIQSGHQSQALSVCISPKGNIIASSGADQKIKLWDVRSGLLLHTFIDHDGEVNDVRFSSTGDSLISSCADKLVRIYDLKNFRLLTAYKVNQASVNSTLFYQKGFYLSGGLDKYIYLGIIGDSSKYSWRYKLTDALNTISSAGSAFAASGDDGKIYYWENPANKPIIYEDHTAPVTSLSFSRSGSELLSRDAEDNIIVRNINTGSIAARLKGASVKSALSADGSLVAYSSAEGKIHIYNLSAGKVVKTLHGHKEQVIALEFSSDGRSLVSAGIDGSVSLWNVSKGYLIRSFSGDDQIVTDIEYSPELNLLVSSYPNGLYYWDLASGITPLYSKINFENVNDIKLADDKGSALYAGINSLSDNAGIYDYTSGKSLKELKASDDPVRIVEVSKDKKYAAFASQGIFHIYDPKLQSEIKEIELEDFALISSFAISPKDNSIAAGGFHGAIALVDINTGAVKASIKNQKENNYPRKLLFSSSGDTLYAAFLAGDIAAFNAATGEKLFEAQAVHGGKSVNYIDLSPSGKYIISAGGDNNICLLEAKNLKKLKELRNIHDNIVRKALFVENDDFIATIGTNAFIKLWDVKKSELILTFAGFPGGEWAAVSPKGQFDGSESGLKNLHWVQNQSAVPLDAFFKDFFTPRLASLAFALNYPALFAQKKADEPVIEKPQFNNEQANIFARDIAEVILYPEENEQKVIEEKAYRSPLIKTLSPLPYDTLEVEVINLTLEAQGLSNPLKEIKIYANGKQVRWDQFPAPLSSVVLRDYPVYIEQGLNKFEIVAVDQNGVESGKYDLTVVRKEKAKIKPDLYIVSIGINAYEDKEFILNYAKNDAEALAERLKLNKGLFNKIELVELYDDKARKQNIISKLEQISAKSKPEDVLVIFFSGHGYSEFSQENKIPEFYLILNDYSEAAKEESLKSKAISSKELARFIINAPPRKQLIMIDACMSGAGIKSIYSEIDFAKDKAIAQMVRDAGITAIASSSVRDPSFEEKLTGHGIFTDVLLEGLNGGADTGNNEISAWEIRQYIQTQMPKKSLMYGRRQIPYSRSEGSDFNIYLLQNASN